MTIAYLRVITNHQDLKTTYDAKIKAYNRNLVVTPIIGTLGIATVYFMIKKGKKLQKPDEYQEDTFLSSLDFDANPRSFHLTYSF